MTESPGINLSPTHHGHFYVRVRLLDNACTRACQSGLRRFSMILTTEVGGQRSNRSTMPVPQRFDWTRVNTLQFITTLQAYHALWKVKLLWYPDVIFNILCVRPVNSFKIVAKLLSTSHKPGLRPLLLLVPLFCNISFNISSALTRRRFFL